MKEYTIVYDEKNHERKYIRYEAGIPIILSKDIVIDECNKEIERLNNNWNKLKEWAEKPQVYICNYHIVDKMNEIEEMR